MLQLKNNKPTLLNLGTRKGHMLMFLPHETKYVDDEVQELFIDLIEFAVSTHSLSLLTTHKDMIDEKLPLRKGKKVALE